MTLTDILLIILISLVGFVGYILYTKKVTVEIEDIEEKQKDGSTSRESVLEVKEQTRQG